MKIAYFDTISGISGDMTLGAFIHAGISVDELSNELKKLSLNNIELDVSHVDRNGIAAVKVDVIIPNMKHHHRTLSDIFQLIDASSISEKVKTTGKKIFLEVANAEARVHNMPVDGIHFHEVGAFDSIVDIIGTAICLDKLNIQAVYSSPIKLGNGGFMETAHGKLPLPCPAASEILKGYPVILTDIPFELTTPTGAAIIKVLSSGVISSERLNCSVIGYGAGTRKIPQIPNLLRLMIGELLPTYEEVDEIIIETNIDDMNPEIYPFVIEQFLKQGANDAYLTPIIMKKGRPGIKLSVLSSSSILDNMLKIFFSQTSTLGVRIMHVERKKINRELREINTKFGKMIIKVINYDGCERYAPEYEECKRISMEKGIPLLYVYKIIEQECF